MALWVKKIVIEELEKENKISFFLSPFFRDENENEELFPDSELRSEIWN